LSVKVGEFASAGYKHLIRHRPSWVVRRRMKVILRVKFMLLVSDLEVTRDVSQEGMRKYLLRNTGDPWTGEQRWAARYPAHRTALRLGRRVWPIHTSV